ncbi:MAG: sigma-70 family RNA polymerase sigma factor, partial [Ignavibacteriales bacterium]|nr:sigma-70 family RNA polymerase sigma factor [Ignavibacteriales bacterium]
SLFDDKYIVDWSTLTIKQLENNELREILDRAINKLTPEYRMVFTLRDVEQLSIEETSKITGLSVSAIKSRLHRARAFLRKELTKEFVK